MRAPLSCSCSAESAAAPVARLTASAGSRRIFAIRLQGRGDRFFAYVEYCTSKWRAGGDDPGGFRTVPDPETGRKQLAGFPLGKPLRWSLRYEPEGNGGTGSVTVTLGDERAVCPLAPGHRADGFRFTHFGLLNVMKCADDGGEVWIDNVHVLGETERFHRDPKWDGRGNRRSYRSANVRPRFDFGWSPTRYAGGKGKGEIGGLVFRGDCREAHRMACYGAKLPPLDVTRPLRASGRVCLRRGVSDSTTLFGFYHSRESMARTDSQAAGLPKSFLGLAVEGPSREGFLFYPAYRLADGDSRLAGDARPPHILPDGKPHDWTLVYTPSPTGGGGRVVLTLDGQAVELDVKPEGTRAQFDRIGFITTWIDGNGQEIYFDDLACSGFQD